MRIEDFDYHLPEEAIAQEPLAERDASRLLVLDRRQAQLRHQVFRDLPDILQAGDLLVVNRTRVFPARLLGRRPTGGEAEVLLVRRLAGDAWEALVRPGRRLRPGDRISHRRWRLGLHRVRSRGRRRTPTHPRPRGKRRRRRRPRTPGPRPPAAVHPAARQARGPPPLPDHLRPRTGKRRGPHRRPALHAGPHGKPRSPGRRSARRCCSTSGPAPSSP